MAKEKLKKQENTPAPVNVHNVILLDKSTSMLSDGKWEHSISSFNEQSDELRAVNEEHADQNHLVSLYTFNSRVNTDFVNKNPIELPILTKENYIPSGMTALFDTISHAITETKKSMKEGDVVNMIVISDGQDNKSTLKKGTITEMVKELEDTGDWTFSYLNADLAQSTEEVRGNVGFSNVVTSSLDSGIGQLYKKNTRNFASSVTARQDAIARGESYSMRSKSLFNSDSLDEIKKGEKAMPPHPDLKKKLQDMKKAEKDIADNNKKAENPKGNKSHMVLENLANSIKSDKPLREFIEKKKEQTTDEFKFLFPRKKIKKNAPESDSPDTE